MKKGIAHLATLTALLALNAWASDPAEQPGPYTRDEAGPAAATPAQSAILVAWGDMTIQDTIDTQTSFARRTATEAERRSAIRTGQAIYSSYSPAKKAELKKKKIRYMAVAIVPSRPRATAPPAPSAPSRPPAAETPSSSSNVDVMIYDTLGGTTVNKYVYSLNAPSVGSTVTVDQYDTLYVGR